MKHVETNRKSSRHRLEQRRHLLFVVVLCVLCACSYPPVQFHYTGEGQFEDRGTFEPNLRYILTIGSIVPNNPNSELIAQIGPLPGENFVIGFSGDDLRWNSEREVNNSSVGDPTLTVTLSESQTNRLVFEASGCLSDWTWSFKGNDDQNTFVYKTNRKKAPPHDGTQFEAKEGELYTLKVKVNVPGKGERPLSVRALGGGYY